MSRIRAKDTQPEMRLRRVLYSHGIRYRVHYPIRGKPDIVFVRKRIAVFIHGCFWHSHGCKNSTIPKSNKKFWITKLKQNVLRDKKNFKVLTEGGWGVITIWECQIEKDASRIVNGLLELVS